MVTQELMNKYDKEITDLVNKLEKQEREERRRKERKERRRKELSVALREILEELDALGFYANLRCVDCGEIIDIASCYEEIVIEE